MGKAFTSAMLDFFGKKEGQSAIQFGQELKALSFKEKTEFSEMLQTRRRTPSVKKS